MNEERSRIERDDTRQEGRESERERKGAKEGRIVEKWEILDAQGEDTEESEEVVLVTMTRHVAVSSWSEERFVRSPICKNLPTTCFNKF